MKTSELTRAALDWAVAMAKKHPSRHTVDVYDFNDYIFNPSTDWAQGGPIIERDRISMIEECDGTWMGSIGGCTDLDMPLYQEHGPTPLIAAMRCYCVSKLGDEIEIPEELQ